ncbi:MAG: ABC transporter substrate-binding protein [Gammaproteobacteria bacterium]|nr:ABC transporter substrate-binding protein [Gammaproteobacteria bacterium]
MKPIDHYTDLLQQRRITRREFIARALALGATLPFATMLASNAAKAAGPKKGGHYKQGLTGGSSSDVLDPAQTLDSYMINVSSGQLRNNLTEISPSGELIGELAENWSSDDAVTWTFKLRQGVEFHNGKSLEANDVVASFNHHRGEDTKSAAKGIVEPITDVKADGKDTVVFTLSGGNADFPFLVSDYHLTICPANADGTMDWQSGVGTGGYVLESFEPGVNTVVKRNPNYWKQDRAFFDSVENLFIADATARTNAVVTGEIHSMSNLDLKTVHLLQRNDNVQVFPVNGNKHATLPMLTNTPPFDNNDLRLALKYAINREELVQKILKGQGEAGNDHPVGPANIYRATPDELPQRQYAPEKAKFHFKKAGMENQSVKIHLADTAFEGAVDAGQLYVESAKAAGITIEIVREPNDGYWSNVWLVKPWCASYWGGRPTEDWVFSQIYSSGADWNESKWEHERFNKLLIDARAELDTKKRREMYVEMQRIVNAEGGSVIPIFMAYTHAASKKIGLPEQLANNWELDGHKNAERWWFV